MALSQAQFNAVLSSLRSDRLESEEKRRAPRVGIGTRATVLMHSSRKSFDVYVRDLSVSGVGITGHHSMAAGDHFSLLLTRQNEKPAHVLCEVKYCREPITGLYDVGAQFVKTDLPPQTEA